jgi:hypothetical protein
MASRGRPTALTPKVRDVIVMAVAEGCPLGSACAAAGVSATAGYEWLRRGRGQGARPNAPVYAQFADALARAEAESEAALVRHWYVAAASDWRAARDLLARRFPERWGKSAAVAALISQVRREIAEDGLDPDEVLAEAERIIREGDFGA